MHKSHKSAQMPAVVERGESSAHAFRQSFHAGLLLRLANWFGRDGDDWVFCQMCGEKGFILCNFQPYE